MWCLLFKINVQIHCVFHLFRSYRINVLLLLYYPCYRLLYKDVSTLIFNLKETLFLWISCQCIIIIIIINIVGISNNCCDNFRPRFIIVFTQPSVFFLLEEMKFFFKFGLEQPWCYIKSLPCIHPAHKPSYSFFFFKCL